MTTFIQHIKTSGCSRSSPTRRRCGFARPACGPRRSDNYVALVLAAQRDPPLPGATLHRQRTASSTRSQKFTLAPRRWSGFKRGLHTDVGKTHVKIKPAACRSFWRPKAPEKSQKSRKVYIITRTHTRITLSHDNHLYYMSLNVCSPSIHCDYGCPGRPACLVRKKKNFVVIRKSSRSELKMFIGQEFSV